MKLSVRFELNPQDKALLEQLAVQDGDTSMSAVLRRLVREEAQRREIAHSAFVPGPGNFLAVQGENHG